MTRRITKRDQILRPLVPWVPDLHPDTGGPEVVGQGFPSTALRASDCAQPHPTPPEPTRAPGQGLALASAEDSGAAQARERGLVEGLAAAEQAYRAKLARVEAQASALRQERDQFFTRIEPELVRLAVSIAEKVIGQELELRPEIVVDTVRAAMKRLRDREAVRVSVNPGDAARVKEARDDLMAAVDGVRRLDVVEDRRVDPGGCVIESSNGTLDARIRTQIGEISRALGELIPEGDESSVIGPEPIPEGSARD